MRRALNLVTAAALAAAAQAALPVGRFVEGEGAGSGPLKRIPAGAGFESITEAVATEFGALIELVRQAVREKVRFTPGFADCYVDVQGMWPDRAVIRLGGRLWSYPYSVNADNSIAVGEPAEVVAAFVPVREAAAGASDFRLLEAKDGGVDIEVTVIQAGVSGNGNLYTDASLDTLVPLLEGARVFVKSDAEHIKGGGKSVQQLIGGLYGPKLVRGATPDTGRVTATFKALSASEPAVVKMVEALKRGLQGLMGLSIDAAATTRKATREGKTVREAVRFVKVNSVDLIVEPGAGGGLDRLAEAAATNEPNPNPASTQGDPVNKKRLLAALAAINAARAAGFTEASGTAEVLVALQEACATAGIAYGEVLAVVEAAADDAAVKPGCDRLAEAARTAAEARRVAEARGQAGGTEPVTKADLEMFRIRQASARKVDACGLAAPARERLHAQLDARERFTEAEVDQLITAERAYLARMTESGRVALGGAGSVEVVGSNVVEMLDAFFDPAHKDHRRVHSFKECYIAMTGDRRVSGDLRECHLPTLRESVGALMARDGDATSLRESMDSTTLANALGSSITRRLLQVYGQQTDLQAWRRIASVTSVGDFRSQERTTIGGYGNLPAVAQGAAYTALTSPSDLKATYTVSKRGGTEDVTLEMIKNDDVGAIRRIPVDLALAAANTLFEFVFDFPRANAAIYDTVALYHASHANLFTAALSATEFAAHRLAMAKQTRLGSAKRRGATPKTLLVPFDLQETAFNLFQRNQNLDKTFVNSQQPDIIVVPYWTDANDWVTVADPMVLPFLEIGFLDGREEPELFMQDTPNVGSLFSNDKWTWKIRHIYSATVLPEGEKATTKAVVP